MNSVYNIRALETFCRDTHRRKLFCRSFFKKGLPLETCLEKAPELAGQLSFQSLTVADRFNSEQDGATRLVLKTADGHRIETVILRIASGRTSLCLSSQAGCAAGCRFCATGSSGFVRNLTAAEILDQVLLAVRILREEKRALRNVVFMGMGEPLCNEENLFRCLETLRDPCFFNLSGNHLTVSSVGIPDAMERFTERFPEVRFALSLHSARQEVRERLMPVARVHTLNKLKPVLSSFAKDRLMIEILLLKGVNDGPDELSALTDFLKGTDAHINLIQFNEWPGTVFEPVSREDREEFGRRLKKAGFKVTLRYSLGGDIAAACGQLASGKTPLRLFSETIRRRAVRHQNNTPEDDG